MLNVGGVPNASGFWTITAISPTVIDLQGSFFTGTYTSGGTATFTHANLVDLAENVYTGLPSVFAGAYTSGGTCLEYYAGMLAETIAIGQSFASYKLRAFPSGALNINNANITLSSSVGQIILNPNTTQISLTNFANLSEIVLDATVPSLTFFDQTGTPQVTLEILQEAPIQVTAITIASPAVFTVPGNTYIQGDTVLVTGATVNRNLLGYRIVENVNALLNQFTLTDLAGNPINTSAPETGIVFTARYYAGLLAQTLALGGSWSAFRLRFFADGRLVINNASIENSVISGGTATFTTFTSVGGTAPNTITLTINNGLLTIVGAGTQAGKGSITIDGTITAAIAQIGEINYIATETGVNNAIASAAASGPAVVDGLEVTVQLAHTLQAGANTYAHNAGAAVPILSHIDAVSNIAVPYAATGRIRMSYKLSIPAWLDLSQ